jgi:hypothetical protein
MFFLAEEYDAGASLSTLKEAEWRTTQHPVHAFQVNFELKEGHIILMF